MNPMEAFNNLSPDQQKQVVDLGLKATEKLSNGIFKVLGFRFEAKHMKAIAEAEAYKIKALADAKSYEINTIGEAIRNNQDLPMAFNNGDTSLSIDTTNTEQLIQRSNYRLQYQQARKEHNIESVIGKTVLELEDKTVESTDDVDEDWLNRFFNIVEDVSDEQLQSLWSRILAGEILQPHSYSLRLLEFLRNISKDELELILKIMPFITGDVIFNDDNVLSKYDINYGLILKLDEIGILNSSATISQNYDLNNNEQASLFDNKEIICVVNNKSSQKKHISIPIFTVNEIGLKLQKLSNTEMNIDFVKEILTSISKENNEICFSLNKIKSINGTQIFYDENPIFEVEQKN